MVEDMKSPPKANKESKLTDEELVKRLKLLIAMAYPSFFTPEFQVENPINDEIRLDILGRLVSKYTEWNGEDIFKVAQSAFQDSNFHTFNKAFELLWNRKNELSNKRLLSEKDLGYIFKLQRELNDISRKVSEIASKTSSFIADEF